MRFRRNWIDYLLILAIVLTLVGFFVLRARATTREETRNVRVDGFNIELPQGFRMLNKEEKKALGIADRIVVLSKGNMAHVILIDVEKGIPARITNRDVYEYYKVTLEELEKNVDEGRIVRKSRDYEKKSYEIVYTGKIKQDRFIACYYSVLKPGRKLNINISVPEDEEEVLKAYLVEIKSGISYRSQ